MTRILAVLALALSLTGCARFTEKVGFVADKVQSVIDVVSGATVSPEAVVVASNTFNAVQVTATAYLRLKPCSDISGPICRDRAVSKPLIAAVKAGRIARDDLQRFMKEHPGQLGPGGLYDALTQSIDTLQAMFVQYKIGAAS